MPKAVIQVTAARQKDTLGMLIQDLQISNIIKYLLKSKRNVNLKQRLLQLVSAARGP